MARSIPSATKPLVVVVEGDDALCHALKFSLELEGYEVDMCESGEALLQRSLPSDHTCLVIDERLPGVAGLAALQQLRRRNVGLPAVIMTTNPTLALRKAAADAAVPIVEKPLLGDVLLGKIRAALNPADVRPLGGPAPRSC